eukprot:ctg_606.g191
MGPGDVVSVRGVSSPFRHGHAAASAARGDARYVPDLDVPRAQRGERAATQTACRLHRSGRAGPTMARLRL